MKKAAATIIIGLMCILAYACSQGEKKIMLRFKYEPGVKLNFEQTANRHVKVFTADSVLKDYTDDYRMEILQEIVRFVDDTTAEMHEHHAWQYEMPNKEDSAKIDTVRKSRDLIVQVLPNGKVVDIDFGDEASITAVSYIKNYYEQGMPVFPSGELSPGYEWTQTTKVVLPDENMEASTTYTVKSLVRESRYDCVVIEYSGNMVIPVVRDPEDTTMSSGIDRISNQGTMYFAYKDGLVVKLDEHWKIDGDRTRLKKGEMEEFKIAVELDVDYILKEKTSP